MKKLLLSFCFFSSLIADQTFLVDPHYSPYMGASNLLLGNDGLIKLEDYAIPPKQREGTPAIFGRWVEQLVWGSASLLTTITQHEVFGHGYRLRELGSPPIGYGVTLWGGYTKFDLDDSFLMGNLLAVDVAGLEGESILANTVKMKWMETGVIDGRAGLTYFLPQQSLFYYTINTHIGRLLGAPPSEGNDVENYLSLLAEAYPNSNTTMGDLTLWAAFGWLDPMTFYSLFSWFYYIAEGTPWEFPSFKIGKNIRYLPNIKIAYAPYAPEAYFENFFSINSHPLYCYIKGGPRSAGLGLFYEHLLEYKKATFGLHVDGWAQRKFVSSTTIGEYFEDEETSVSMAAPSGMIFGGAASITSKIKLNSSFNLFLELGGKTKGYLPGYALAGGLVIRGGITLANY